MPCPAGIEHLCEPARVLPLVSEAIEDQESPDDPSAATLPDAAAAASATEAYNAGAVVRQATLQKVQALQAQLAQVSMVCGLTKFFLASWYF